MISIILLVLVFEISPSSSTSTCPTAFSNGLVCSGHQKGKCVGQNCQCMEKYFGADCSKRACPTGSSWGNSEISVCSSRGICNFLTGTCDCFPNFSGHACEKLECAGTTESALSQTMSDDVGSVNYAWRSKLNTCNGNGVCMSVRDYAWRFHGVSYVEERWDIDRIFGCVCDEGYDGYDCSIRTCPRGDDPQTTSQTDEVQLLRCKTFSSSSFSSSSTFRVGFENSWSVPVASNETIEIFERIMNEVPGRLGRVSVHAENDACNQVCCAGEETVQVLSLTFLENFGDLPPLRLDTTSIESEIELEIACATNTQATCLRSTFAESFRSGEVTVSRAVMGTCV